MVYFKFTGTLPPGIWSYHAKLYHDSLYPDTKMIVDVVTKSDQDSGIVAHVFTSISQDQGENNYSKILISILNILWWFWKSFKQCLDMHYRNIRRWLKPSVTLTEPKALKLILAYYRSGSIWCWEQPCDHICPYYERGTTCTWSKCCCWSDNAE